MGLVYRKNVDLSGIWGTRHFLHPKLHALGDGQDAINPHTFVDRIGYRFFAIGTDREKVGEVFVAAMDRGSKTLNSMIDTCLSDELEAVRAVLRVGFFSDIQKFDSALIEARSRYRALEGKHGDPANRLALYEVVRGIEIGHQILRADTEREVQLSLRHYRELVEWFAQYLGISRLETGHQTSTGIPLCGETPFRSRLKYLTPSGTVKYSSIIMKTYLDLLELDVRRKSKVVRDYTGVEFVVPDDKAVAALVADFRYASPTGRLEAYKERERGTAIRDNRQASSVFGLTKFVCRVPIPFDAIAGHPLGNLNHQLVPVEVQILTLEDERIRNTTPEAGHSEYKKRQFMAIFPALYPREIYEPVLAKL